MYKFSSYLTENKIYNNYEDQRISAVQGNNQCRMFDLFEKESPFWAKCKTSFNP